MATLSPQRVPPLLELGWELPFQFTDRANRVPLFLYTLVLVGPLIAIGKLIWADIRGLRSEAT
jgi:hypothetical protein